MKLQEVPFMPIGESVKNSNTFLGGFEEINYTYSSKLRYCVIIMTLLNKECFFY